MMRRLDDEAMTLVVSSLCMVEQAATDARSNTQRAALWEELACLPTLTDEEREIAAKTARELKLFVNCLKKYIVAKTYITPDLTIEETL